MLFDPTRHEALQAIPWDAVRAQAFISHIVSEAEAAFSPQGLWPPHPRDVEPGEDASVPAIPLYYGATGVVWALHYLQDVGAASLKRSYLGLCDELLARNQAWLGKGAEENCASYLMGETPLRLLQHGAAPSAALEDRLAELVAGNLDHPARELMWGSPGTLLTALFMHQRTGQARWAELFRATARRLWSQLVWSEEQRCHYWTQDMYGRRSDYIDAVHGFVGTALPLINGSHLLPPDEWQAWQACIEKTVQRTAQVEDGQANWRAWLAEKPTTHMLMQYCHGAPGFVVCLASMPGNGLDELLCAAGEAVWAAGPLAKGSNLCHGTGGNGYTFLKLHQRTGNPVWLERARAFAMHGIAQTEADARQYGQLRHSLWTGDPGFAIYLWDCLRGRAAFPTLDVFDAT